MDQDNTYFQITTSGEGCKFFTSTTVSTDEHVKFVAQTPDAELLRGTLHRLFEHIYLDGAYAINYVLMKNVAVAFLKTCIDPHDIVLDASPPVPSIKKRRLKGSYAGVPKLDVGDAFYVTTSHENNTTDCKIGRTNDLNERLQKYRSNAPRTTVYQIIYTPMCVYIERVIKSFFSHCRTSEVVHLAANHVANVALAIATSFGETFKIRTLADLDVQRHNHYANVVVPAISKERQTLNLGVGLKEVSAILKQMFTRIQQSPPQHTRDLIKYLERECDLPQIIPDDYQQELSHNVQVDNVTLYLYTQALKTLTPEALKACGVDESEKQPT